MSLKDGAVGQAMASHALEFRVERDITARKDLTSSSSSLQTELDLIQQLRANVQQLAGLQSMMRFMLVELNDLVKKSR